MKLLTLTELRPNLRVRLSEEVRHMPIVVRPEDIRLSKKKFRKDLLYSIGLEEGLLMEAQELVLKVIHSKLGYIPEKVEEKVKGTKDRKYLHNLIEKLISSQDVEGLLRKELHTE